MYKDTKEKLKEVCDQTIESIEELESGSEERSRAVKDAVLMYNAQVEEWKLAEDREDRRYRMSHETNIEKDKIRIEEDKLKRDAEIEAAKLEVERQKQKNETIGKGLVAGAMVVTTALALKDQKEGYLVPKEISRLCGDLPRLFKFW